MDDRESTQDVNDVKKGKRKKGNNILSLIQYKKTLSLQMERKT